MQRTRILPLRWIGNVCGEIATDSLVKAWALQDTDDLGYRFKFHSWVWEYVNRPYMWWGTYYTIDFNRIKVDPVLDKLGSDYDEDGIPYWEKE